MAKDSSGRGRPGTPDARRKPVTIDLAAEEVSGKDAASAQPDASPDAPKDAPKPESASRSGKAGTSPKPEAPPAGGARSGQPSVSEKAAPSKAGAPKQAGAADAAATKASASSGPTPRQPGAAPQSPQRPPPESPPPESSTKARASFLSLLFAAILGGVITIVVLVILVAAGFYSLLSSDPDAELIGQIEALETGITNLEQDLVGLLDKAVQDVEAAVDGELTKLQQSIAGLESGVVQAVADDPAVKAIEESLNTLEPRLAQLEESINTALTGAPSDAVGAELAAELNALAGDLEALKTAVAPDLSAIENGLAALRTDVEALKNAARPDFSGLEGALADLRGDVETLSAQLAQAPSAERLAAMETRVGAAEQAAAQSGALGSAVAADALATSLATGQPFTGELAALRSLGVDPQAIAALEPHAETGLPTRAEISARFEAAIAGLALTPPIEEDSGVLNRLIGSARNLVEVRPAGPTAGDNPGAVVARIRGALQAGDLEAALAERDGLPPDAKTATTEWSEMARTRLEAEVLVAKLRADALSRLETEG